MVDLADFEALADALRGKVNKYALDLYESHYRSGEYRLAVEELCDKVDDADELIPHDQRFLLRRLGDRYGVDRASFLELVDPQS